MSEAITVSLNLVTPLWTGDDQRQSHRTRETGVLGSLRWWYEAILRGVGLYACDPSEAPCIYDADKELSSVCLACQLFGCTGLGRRFRLLVNGGGDAGDPVEVRLKHPAKRNHRGWRIPPKVAGPLKLTILSLQREGLTTFNKSAIYYTLQLISRYGALGAKTSHGQGVVKVTGLEHLHHAMKAAGWIHEAQNLPAKNESNMPCHPNTADFVGVTVILDSDTTTRHEWWGQIQVDVPAQFVLGSNPQWIPSAPAVRAELRKQISSQPDRHRLMGTIKPEPQGSNILVTHLYRSDDRWEMRIFGFIPRDGTQSDQSLRKLFGNTHHLSGQLGAALGRMLTERMKIEPYPVGTLSLLGD